ncbi:MAG: hypothetical protein ACRC1H_04565, partial [Caldilineaceae bacterium]
LAVQPGAHAYASLDDDSAVAPSAPRGSTPVGIPGPLTVGQLLDRSFRLYRARFRGFVIPAAIFLLPISVLSGLATGRVMNSFQGLAQLPFATPAIDELERVENAMSSIGSTVGVSLLVSLLSGAALLLCSLALTGYAIEALHGREQSAGRAVGGAFRRFWAMLGMSLLRLLAMMGAGMVLWLGLALVFVLGTLGIGFLGSVVGDASAASSVIFGAAVVLLFCLGIVAMVALIAPLVYLYLRWFVATPALVDQHAGPVESLRISWRLTKGGAARVLGYGLLLYILSSVVVTLPLMLLQWGTLIFATTTGYLAALSAVTILVGAVFNILWQPLFAIALVLLYFDLRVRRESYDLTLRVAALEAELAPNLPTAGAA